ncbi:NAD-glutamate dehydrogenase domain-containing protein [Hoyosella altamirensis]|uniref:NAD-glutamate dehydrogenase domain-containing protein n=1 Tax=Hoyosella altamirensis TaxID=616997 RepID=UPI0007DB5C95|nr:NAD-glutamate dehydrogenase domain-containing protein [Hoyosella altamirensis]
MTPYTSNAIAHSAQSGVALALDRLRSGPDFPVETPKMTFLQSPRPGASSAEAFVLWPAGAPLLSDVTATFGRFGFKVADRAHLPLPSGFPPEASLHRFTFQVSHTGADGSYERVSDAFEAAHTGDFEVDDYSVLVLAEGISWREAVLVRAASRFLRQAGLSFSHTYVVDTMLRHSGFARAFVTYFAARFEPAAPNRDDRVHQAHSALTAHLDRAVTVDDDRTLRALASFVTACVRTNWYQTDAAGTPKPYASFMLDSAQLAAEPKVAGIVPLREIYIHSRPPRRHG